MEKIVARETLSLGSHLLLILLPALFGGICISLVVFFPDELNDMTSGQYSWVLEVLVYAVAVICPVLIFFTVFHILLVIIRGYKIIILQDEMTIYRWGRRHSIPLNQARWCRKELSDDIVNAGDFGQIMWAVIGLFFPLSGLYVETEKRKFLIAPDIFTEKSEALIIEKLELYLGQSNPKESDDCGGTWHNPPQ